MTTRPVYSQRRRTKKFLIVLRVVTINRMRENISLKLLVHSQQLLRNTLRYFARLWCYSDLHLISKRRLVIFTCKHVEVTD